LQPTTFLLAIRLVITQVLFLSRASISSSIAYLHLDEVLLLGNFVGEVLQHPLLK
jgi:hypothetical protein